MGNLCQTRCKHKILGLRLYRGKKEKRNLLFHPNLRSTRFHATYIFFCIFVFCFLLFVKVVIFNFECFFFFLFLLCVCLENRNMEVFIFGCVCFLGYLFSMFHVLVSLTIFNVWGVFSFCCLFSLNDVLFLHLSPCLFMFFLYMCKFLFLTFHIVTNVVHVLILKHMVLGITYFITLVTFSSKVLNSLENILEPLGSSIYFA